MSAAKRDAPTWIEGKDRRLEVLSEAPLILSTPLDLLAGQRVIEKEALFVRNIQDLAEGHTLEPRPIEGGRSNWSG